VDLSYKQRLFVEYYLGVANGNGTKAAQLAGYGAPNVAAVAAHRLLKNAKIATFISERISAAAISADEVLARLSEHATADLGDFIRIDDEGGFRLDLTRAKRAKRTRVLKKLKVTVKTFSGQAGDSTETKSEIELHNPQFALDKLAQYHGLYKSGPDADDGDDQRRIDIPGLDAELSGRQSPEGGDDPGDAPA